MDINSKDDAVMALRALAEQHQAVRLQAARTGRGVEMIVTVPVKSIGQIADHPYVRDAKQILNKLLPERTGGFLQGASGGNLEWKALLNESEASVIRNSGAAIPEQTLADVKRESGWARGIGSGDPISKA